MRSHFFADALWYISRVTYVHAAVYPHRPVASVCCTFRAGMGLTGYSLNFSATCTQSRLFQIFGICRTVVAYDRQTVGCSWWAATLLYYQRTFECVMDAKYGCCTTVGGRSHSPHAVLRVVTRRSTMPTHHLAGWLISHGGKFAVLICSVCF